MLNIINSHVYPDRKIFRSSFKGLDGVAVYDRQYDWLEQAETYGLDPSQSFPHKGDTFVANKLGQMFAHPQNCSVIDIGAGNGRNSIPLAENGYNITAIEPSIKGREAIEYRAKQNNLSNISVFSSESNEDFDIVQTLPQDLTGKNDAAIWVHGSANLPLMIYSKFLPILANH